MAEDFREALGLGHDDRTIASVDAQGVALAAIQGSREGRAAPRRQGRGDRRAASRARAASRRRRSAAWPASRDGPARRACRSSRAIGFMAPAASPWMPSMPTALDSPVRSTSVRSTTPLEYAAGDTILLFTDIEGSTRLWEREPERMSVALASHDAMARAAVESHGGAIVKMTGDGFLAAFDRPEAGIGACVALQQALADASRTNGITLRIRCGLHQGRVERRDNDLFGPPVNRTARLMAVAHGGQILVSQAVVEALGTLLPEGVTLRDLGGVRLKDLTAPERVYQILHPQLRRDF